MSVLFATTSFVRKHAKKMANVNAKTMTLPYFLKFTTKIKTVIFVQMSLRLCMVMQRMERFHGQMMRKKKTRRKMRMKKRKTLIP